MYHLDAIFSALSDKTRRDIVARLAVEDMPLSKLAKPFDMSLTAVSKHVRVLSDAGLVVVEKHGRTRHCHLEAVSMKHAADWLSTYQKFWQEQLSSLAHYLQEEDNK